MQACPRPGLRALLLGLLPLAVVGAGHAQKAFPLEPFRIVSVSPPPNALDVPRTSSVMIRFNRAVVLDQEVSDLHLQGRWSGVNPVSFHLEPGGRVLRVTPSRDFSAGEMVTVIVSGNLRDRLGNRLERGTSWSFWVDSRASSAKWSLFTSLTAGNVPYGAYGGDIDADGDLDLCVPNELTADVSVYLNNGQGLDAPVAYTAGRNCSANEAADLDFDGNLDLVVANISDGDVSVLMGNGDGTFQPQVRYKVGDGPRGLALFDANGDGLHDLATANRVSSDMSLLLGRGDGTFEPEKRFHTGLDGEKSCAAADMNNDGWMDLVVCGLVDDMARVLLNDGTGNFVAQPARYVGDQPFTLVAGDVDGDGNNDIGVALAGADAAVSVCLGDGNGGLGPAALYPTGPFTVSVDFGDLNGDGRLDMSGSSFNGGTFSLFRNKGGGLFGNRIQLPALIAGSCTVLHDIDGDGDVDVTGIDEQADQVYVFLQSK